MVLKNNSPSVGCEDVRFRHWRLKIVVILQSLKVGPPGPEITKLAATELQCLYAL